MRSTSVRQHRTWLHALKQFTVKRAKDSSGAAIGAFVMLSFEKLQTVLFLFVAALFAVGGANASTFNLAGSEWGFAGETGKAARFVQFRSNGRVGGYSGCNRFTGSYTQKGDAIKMGQFATTRMACQPEVMEREQQFFVMLDSVRFVKGTHLKLILRDGSGAFLAELVRRDPD